jgi:hypothetical protein
MVIAAPTGFHAELIELCVAAGLMFGLPLSC